MEIHRGSAVGSPVRVERVLNYFWQTMRLRVVEEELGMIIDRHEEPPNAEYCTYRWVELGGKMWMMGCVMHGMAFLLHQLSDGSSSPMFSQS